VYKYFICFLVLLFSFYDIHTEENIAEKAYADVILDSKSILSDSLGNIFYGMSNNKFPVRVSTKACLGNNNSFVSLPYGSYICAGFTDNAIVDYPGQDDIFIREAQASGEKAAIFVSSNGKDYVYLGEASDDRRSSFDLHDINFSEPVIAIKIQGLDNKGKSPGFDLVSIMGLPKSSIDQLNKFDIAGEPSKAPKDLCDTNGTAAEVHFAQGDCSLGPMAMNSIELIAEEMRRCPEMKLLIIGFTDSIGSGAANSELSECRAASVKSMLIKSGISEGRLKAIGLGERSPAAPNASPEGRAKNRRVEFKRINGRRK